MQALEKLLLNKYDLLITSLECPHLNGDAVVAALRLVHNFNKDIEVVLITSRVKESITNKDDFNSILSRKEIKDGALNKVIKKIIRK